MVAAAAAETAVVAEVDAAEAEVVAVASGNEFEVAETVVQLKECAWPDCWDGFVALLQLRQS